MPGCLAVANSSPLVPRPCAGSGLFRVGPIPCVGAIHRRLRIRSILTPLSGVVTLAICLPPYPLADPNFLRVCFLPCAGSSPVFFRMRMIP